MRRTALFDAHRALGARLVPFGGFEMPVQYTSILREHAAVRERAGLFDLSHMAQYELAGAGVGTWADALTVNWVANMKSGQARYNIFTNTAGGAHDDVIFYRLTDERWLLVVNAANAAKMWPIVKAAGPDVSVRDRHGSHALIAIQGPASLDILRGFVTADLAVMKYYSCLVTDIRGEEIIIARTGYTGEDGFEIFCDSHIATDVWDALLAAGREDGLQPAGLGARDVLRLEAGMPLYGHEMTEDIGPLQAGLNWAIKLAKPDFTGKAALEAQRAGDTFDRIAGLVLDGRIPARSGYPVFSRDVRVGEIRSGSIAPSVGNQNVATALLAHPYVAIGTRLDVEIRGSRQGAQVVALPFYKRVRAV